MAKIIKLKTDTDKALDLLEEAKQNIIKYGVNNILIAFKLPKEIGNVMTGYCNLDIGERNELVGHIQADNILDIIHSTYITED